MPVFYICSVISTAAFSTFVIVRRCVVRGTKFRRRESHRTKNCARIIVLGGYTYFVGNTVFRRRYDVLSRAYYAHNGKDSERYGKKSSVTVVQLLTKTSRYSVGHVAAAATAATVTCVLRLSDLSVEYYGIYRLHSRHQIGK